MSGNLSCSLVEAPPPPYTNASCALPVAGNNTAVMTACCGTPATYSSGYGGYLCYQYCNVTPTDTDKVGRCIVSGLENSANHNMTPSVLCFGGDVERLPGSGAARMGNGIEKALWAGTIVVLVGFFIGVGEL